MYASYAILSACHLSPDDFKCQRQCYFSSVLCAITETLDLSIFRGDQANVDELTSLIPIAEFHRLEHGTNLEQLSSDGVALFNVNFSCALDMASVFVTHISYT